MEEAGFVRDLAGGSDFWRCLLVGVKGGGGLVVGFDRVGAFVVGLEREGFVVWALGGERVRVLGGA